MESGDRGDSVIRRRREESAGRRRRARVCRVAGSSSARPRGRAGAFDKSLRRKRARGVRRRRCAAASRSPMRFAAFAANGVRLAAHATPASVDIEPHVCPLSPTAGDPAMPGALRDPAARNPYGSAAGPAPVAVRPDIAARARRCGAALAPKRRRRPLGAARIRRPRGTGLRRRAVVRRTIGAARTAARAAAASRSRGRSPGRRARRRRTTACDENGVGSWCFKAVSWKRRESIARPGSTLTRRVPAIVTNPVTVVTARRSRAGHGHCRNSWGLFGDSLTFS
ncbi:hypothetical protein X898_5305 [Burkholderia pseudomallei ABCPW 91]|nr:hypothetical protein X898_5305 [Burkholderia pseudomallei ABCPW 91]